jgi:hypothetical protein
MSERDPLGLDPSRPLPGGSNMSLSSMGALPPTRKRSSRACDVSPLACPEADPRDASSAA